MHLIILVDILGSFTWLIEYKMQVKNHRTEKAGIGRSGVNGGDAGVSARIESLAP